MQPTERLYYVDSYVREFNANVIATDGNKVYLERTAFYPTSGGQPFDRGSLGSAAVIDVIDEGDYIAHVIDGEAPGGEAHCAIDWNRRFDFMQQHTGQHLLSAVFAELFDFPTISVHFGDESATLDIGTQSLSPEQLERVSERANSVVFEDRRVQVIFGNAAEDLGLRKASDREGVLRVISIEGLDRSACGGTHVRSTAAIGPISIRKLQKVRGNVRVEFVCGLRAVRRARADFESLSTIARAFSAPVDDAPGLVKAQLDRIQDLEKSRKKISADLALLQGRELYQSTPPNSAGQRRMILREPMSDELRTRAQAFAAQPDAVLIVFSESPPSILVAASKDSGVNAGDAVKSAITAHGGRGGGNQALAQGSLPSIDALREVERDLQVGL